MWVIAGLGNPGAKYETTRHNAGFLVVDLLAEDAAASWESPKKFPAEVAKGSLEGDSCLFVKPQTFMNRSGTAVGPLMRFYKLDSDRLIVLHDDIDVPNSKVKARTGGGHGGQNGVRSIIEHLGTNEFHRLKLGVGRPGPDDRRDVSSWVLSPMTDAELLELQKGMLAEVKLRLTEIFKRAR